MKQDFHSKVIHNIGPNTGQNFIDLHTSNMGQKHIWRFLCNADELTLARNGQRESSSLPPFQIFFDIGYDQDPFIFLSKIPSIP